MSTGRRRSTGQGVPVLILSPGRKLAPEAPEPKGARGKQFFNDEKSIRQYLSAQYSLPMPG